MGTFAEKAIVDYRLSIANQGNQTSVLFAVTSGSLPSPFSVRSKQMKIAVFRLFPFFACGVFVYACV
jgi:hypothetical protein